MLQRATEFKNNVSGRQARHAAFWEALHTDQYVSIHKEPRNAASRPETLFA
jgi:hypothetical protein